MSGAPGPHWIPYAHEATDRLRVGFIGCGDHAFRNVYPVLRYLPVELVAVCDRQAERAEAFRRTFGAERAHTDHQKMLETERLDAVLVVTGYGADGRVQHPALAADCLRSGVAAWVEKPPVNDLADVDLVRRAIEEGGGATFGVGFKKAFTPATRKLVALMEQPEFGTLRTVEIRYAQNIPTADKMESARAGRWRMSFLDHLCHPVSLLRAIAGPTRALRYERTENGTGFVTFHLASGALASLHLLGSFHPRMLAERTEVNGDGASVIVENGTRVLWCRNPIDPVASAGKGLHYGRDPDFTGETVDGTVVWEPEWSLGQLYNKGIFLLGYFNELAHFFEAVAARRPVEIGGLDFAEEGIRIFEAFRRPPGELVLL